MINIIKPLVTQGAFFFLLINLVSCSLFKRNDDYWNQSSIESKVYSTQTYEDHLESIGKSFRRKSNIKVMKFLKRDQRYLQKLARENSELEPFVFKKFLENEVTFYRIDDQRPYFFSLPGNQIFFSKGLVNKYLEHESFLRNVILYEMIKLEKKVYLKSKTIPVGFYGVEHVMAISRLPQSIRDKLNIWTYSILEKHSLDSGSYIQWIQILNSNIGDFTFYLGGKESIIKEERDFKDFVIKNYGKDVDFGGNAQSSKLFSKFKKRTSYGKYR